MFLFNIVATGNMRLFIFSGIAIKNFKYTSNYSVILAIFQEVQQPHVARGHHVGEQTEYFEH